MSTELATQGKEMAIKLNAITSKVIGQKNVIGFQKAFVVASAIEELKLALTKEYMAPIMQLQGNRLGFKTDKDKKQDGTKGDGYPESIVKDCLVEATLYGLETTGNQWNIIGGNMYATKEGLKYLLDNWSGLKYDVSFGLIKEDLPNYNAATNVNVPVTLNWKEGEAIGQHQLTIQIRANKGMGIDAVLGKATRKAYKWLYDKISGNPIPEGEATESGFATYETVSSTPKGVSYEDLKELYDLKKDSIPENLVENATRIVENKEAQSYQKLHDYLQKL